MATVYKHSNGQYDRRNEYEVNGYDVETAVEIVIGNPGDWEHNKEYRINRDALTGWGDGAVLIEREDSETGEYEPYMIITAD